MWTHSGSKTKAIFCIIRDILSWQLLNVRTDTICLVGSINQSNWKLTTRTYKTGQRKQVYHLQGIKYAHVRANRNSKTNNEMNLAGVLIVIVIVFLLCHFPRLSFIWNNLCRDDHDNYSERRREKKNDNYSRLIINCTEFLWTKSIRM